MSEANKLYQVNGEDAFKDAEPYYFGNKMPPTGLFRPLPTDDNPSTSENEQEWYQEGQLNGFSVNAPLDGYRHNGAKLSYVKKGTFPKAGKNQQLFLGGVLSSSGNNTTLWDDTKVFKLWLNKNTNELEYENNGIRGTCSAEFLGLPFMPTKFGILLVGAGGGSGGFTWYDPDKNGKKSDQYIVSGSGGGGGGLIWGVIDLENTDAVNYYLIKTGKSGTAGTNASRDGLKKKKPRYGGDGTAGTSTELYWHPNGSKGDGSLLAVAGGGKGGARGNFQTYAAGGDGGTNSYSTHDRFVYCGSKNGGNGCSCYTEPLPKIDAWSVSIKFAQTDDTNYTTTISHGEVSAVVQGGTDKDARAHKVPGGHSYYPGNVSVNGAGGGANGEDYVLAYGRGGAGGDWSDISESGAPGCFILFY